MTRQKAVALILTILCVLTVGCSREFKQRYSNLRTELEIARERGGQWCAPKDFASAEAYLYLAKTEADNRNTKLAMAYLDYVKGHVSSALSQCTNCVTDLDFDGIRDLEDSDPYRAEDYDGWQDQDGIPDPDNDGDGFLDGDDTCPNSPEDFDEWQDQDGCPEVDNDFDQIPDGRDKCPMAVEDLDGWEDSDGCPDPDNDFDNIPDIVDACPIAPETYNNFLDDDGCPDFVPKKMIIIRLPRNITFSGNTLKLSKKAVDELKTFADQCLENPELYIRIEGYTSRNGTTDVLVNRTKERAEEVKRILAEFGIDEGRITTFGFGNQPAKSSGRSGYWVEFVIYQR